MWGGGGDRGLYNSNAVATIASVETLDGNKIKNTIAILGRSMSTINAPPRLRCAICEELVNEPVMLKCLHVYCKECLKNFVSQRPETEFQSIRDHGCDPKICRQIKEIGVSHSWLGIIIVLARLLRIIVILCDSNQAWI